MFLSKSFCNYRSITLLKYNLKYNQTSKIFKKEFSIFSKNEDKAQNVDVSSNFNSKPEYFYLPEPPVSPEILDLINHSQSYNHLGEATFASLGLNSYWPTGWVQAAFEFLHVNCHFSWWGAIATSALIIRLSMFPLSIKIRKMGLINKQITPKVTKLQGKVEEAKMRNDLMTMSKAISELQNLLVKSNYKPYRSAFYTFLQIPPFVIVMVGLREMANLPVASLQSGGLLWFTDLTMCDPYYILPVTTMFLLLLQLEIGADFNKQTKNNAMKWGVRAFPLVGLIFTCNFPSALLLYWTFSSFLSLGFVGIMKLPGVKTRLGLDSPSLVIPVDNNVPTKSGGFLKNLRKDTSENRITNRAKNLESIENERWIKAGTAPIPKTYTYNPTKVKVAGTK